MDATAEVAVAFAVAAVPVAAVLLAAVAVPRVRSCCDCWCTASFPTSACLTHRSRRF